jgi:hypothetical protein
MAIRTFQVQLERIDIDQERANQARNNEVEEMSKQ